MNFQDHYQQDILSIPILLYWSYEKSYYPSGHIAVETIIKFGTGALFDMGMQIVANYYFNSKTAGDFKASFKKVDWVQVTISGIQNLFTFKSKSLTSAITVFGDVIVNWMKQGKKYSCEKALRDFSMGFLSDIAARYVSKFGAKEVAKGMDKMKEIDWH